MKDWTPPEDLDMGLVDKVAGNELRLLAVNSGLAPVFSEALHAVGKFYLVQYESLSPDLVVDRVRDAAYEQAGQGPAVPAGATPEFVLGHALAACAWSHASADLDLVADDFIERATEALDDIELAPASGENIGRDRAAGVDLGKAVRSAQAVTPGFIKNRFLDRMLDPDDAIDRANGILLDDRDWVDVTYDFMSSLGGVDLDYQDYEDLWLRVRAKAAEKPAFEAEVESCREAIEREKAVANEEIAPTCGQQH